MDQLKSLKISIDSLQTETKRILQFIDFNQTKLIFSPTIFDADVDAKTYCKQYHAIKDYITALPLNDDTSVLKDRFKDLPSLTQQDFNYHSTALPVIAYYILLPLGIVTWVNSYYRLSSLSDKLVQIERGSGTLQFMLKALTG